MSAILGLIDEFDRRRLIVELKHAPIMLVLVHPASSTRWLSAWMVTPILRLGYGTATLPAALRTRLVGGEERTVSMIVLA